MRTYKYTIIILPRPSNQLAVSRSPRCPSWLLSADSGRPLCIWVGPLTICIACRPLSRPASVEPCLCPTLSSHASVPPCPALPLSHPV